MTIKYRIISCLAVMFLLFIGLEARLWNIQVKMHSSMKETATRQFEHKLYLDPDRGVIFDRNRAELAQDVNADSIFAIPGIISNLKNTSSRLAPILCMSEAALIEKLKHHSSFVWLKRKVADSTAKRIRGLNLEGICLVQEKKRFYPENELGCQVIGCVGIDNEGLAGIEKNFNKYLFSGRQKEVKLTDALGRDVITTEVASKAERKYSNIVLTIDKYIQHVAEVELKKAYIENKAFKATIIVQDPATGEILALANFPNFNGNELLNNFCYINNPAITEVYEPGSTFKIVAACAALEERIVMPSDKFFCENGIYNINGYPIRDHEKEGWLNFEEVIMKSSNIGMAKIGEKLGKNCVYEYARKFGFGNYTGINMTGESNGILKRPSEWSGISLGRISFGQEIGATALQVIASFSCLANNGRLMQPQIVRYIEDSEGKKTKEFRPVPIRQVISEHTVDVMTRMLVKVVEEGTGAAAAVKGYKVAGKTGTGQKYCSKSGGYSSTRYTASFAGYIPAFKPRVAILVIIDEPAGVYYGGTAAAPVFSRVAEKIMDYYSIPCDNFEMAKANEN